MLSFTVCKLSFVPVHEASPDGAHLQPFRTTAPLLAHALPVVLIWPVSFPLQTVPFAFLSTPLLFFTADLHKSNY